MLLTVHDVVRVEAASASDDADPFHVVGALGQHGFTPGMALVLEFDGLVIEQPPGSHPRIVLRAVHLEPLREVLSLLVRAKQGKLAPPQHAGGKTGLRGPGGAIITTPTLDDPDADSAGEWPQDVSPDGESR